ncbi:MAG: ribonuclease Y [bacterium]|nr:ribonuclease Y [bacterium]
MTQTLVYVAAAVAAAVAYATGWRMARRRGERLHGQSQAARDQVLAEARQEAAAVLKAAELAAREEALTARARFEAETENVRRESRSRQETLDRREDGLDRKAAVVDQKETRLAQQEDDLRRRLAAAEQDRVAATALVAAQRAKLEEVAGLTAEAARQQLLDAMVADARHAAARAVQQAREEAERGAKREAVKILSLAVQRYAAEHVAETTVSVVDLPGDEMKGRIIGRDGRNIRAFEQATGIDVIIDDTPGAVIISGFDPVRREVARQSLELLVRDGRIHPARIEEVVQKTGEELRDRIRELGEQACLEAGLKGVNPELYPYVGRLHYRTSYGQNLLKHAAEVAAVAGVIASELGLDQRLARRCGFLHDIGKAADHEFEGPHAVIGARLCRKFGEDPVVVNAVAAHHQDVEPDSPYTYITAAADAVSASRPGARRESVDTYVERLEHLERIAESFDGVEKSYAIQAGREVRVMVNHAKVSDAEAALLAEEVSRRIESELEYPGQIRIMVIRETRATAIAR